MHSDVIKFCKKVVGFLKRKCRWYFSPRIAQSAVVEVSGVSAKAIFKEKSLIRIDKTAEIKDYVIIQTHDQAVEIGSYTQINPFTVIYGDGGVVIGKNVMIAPHCMIATGNHDFRQTKIPMRFAGSISKGPIIIEDDVWIGANCTITDGVKIAQGAVVGANSVVVHDVNAYDIVAGVPAKVIGNRKD